MTAFAALHVPGRPLLLPNVWDAVGAAALVRAGFTALGTTSLGIAATAGVPDATGAALPATLALVRRLAPLPCRLTVDLEAGDPGTAAAVAAAGAVGINIEDGRPGRTTLAGPDEQQRRIRAIRAEVPDLFVNARTDTHWGRTPDSLRPTLERVHGYLDAGAHGVFVPGLRDRRDIERVVDAIAPAPLNVLLLAGGPGPGELADLGVARISLGSLLHRVALAAAVGAATAIRDGAAAPSGIPGYAEVEQLIAALAPTAG